MAICRVIRSFCLGTAVNVGLRTADGRSVKPAALEIHARAVGAHKAGAT